MEGDKYNSVLNTATFLASKGEVRLALSLVKTSLEKFFIEKESLRPLAEEKAKETTFKIFDVYKKAHGMPSYG